MRVVQIQFAPWDKVYNFDPAKLDLRVGDYVIVQTDLGMEMGKIIKFADFDADKINEEKTEDKIDEETESYTRELKPVLRKALPADLEKLPDFREKRKALEDCKKFVERHKLPMKLVDVHFAYDDSRITFAFIADGRIDFRELVKELTKHFGRTIRLQQIGIRDEAKLMGDYGHCGRQLCCRQFLKDLFSITSEMADVQQCAHRGSDRISGICGRLMCCLAYEEKGYKDMSQKMPPLGVKVDVDGKKGVVVGHHILKQTVDVEFPGEKGNSEGRIIVEVDLNRNKK
ncbi:MAG: regulatory iron-sulfur-containing complex subunit RicT [Patescibacteria group bacterium]|nr:regulatory iron-sulfur-containing complex subunit RicT [Patescibacteria group bacterium]MDD4611091.1 regulatory iron-sulfur-containing complex subunit RicT [Patescibacteria group bacterium]